MAGNKKDNDLESPSSPAWMQTFADLMTLLLTFFVLLLSFSNMKKVKFSTTMQAIQGALGVMPSLNKPVSSSQSSNSAQNLAKSLNKNIKKMKKVAANIDAKKNVGVEITEGGVMIRLGSKVLFDLGSDRLKQSAYPLLKQVGRTIKQYEVDNVIVKGHTDDIPIESAEFDSNWELSTARAISVVRFLIDKVGVAPGQLGAAGYSHYDPLVPNDSPENRQKNRRVEFLISW